MYIPVSINSGGFIHVNAAACHKMVHRETRGLQYETPAASAQGDLRFHCRSIPAGKRAVGIAQLTPEGGVEALWVPESQRDEWTELLKVWKGCYGAWPVHTWKEEDATV